MLRGCDKDLILVHGITARNAMLGMEKKKTRLPIMNVMAKNPRFFKHKLKL